MIKLRELSSHHRKTFDDIMTEPPKSGIKWDEVVALIEDGVAPFREEEEQKRLTLRVPMHIDSHLTQVGVHPCQRIGRVEGNFYELLVGMFRSNYIQPNYVQYIGSTLTILSLVNAGMGVALVPESATPILFDEIMFHPIALPAGIESLLYLAWRDDNDNPVFKVILELIKGVVNNQSGDRLGNLLKNNLNNILKNMC